MNNYRLSYFLATALLLLMLSVLQSCKDEELMSDAPAPHPVSNPTYTATNGGAVITYTLPADKHLFYVKAVYVNSQGEEVFRSSSRYDNVIEIDGFVDETPQKVRLYSVGYNKKMSEAVELEVIPKESYIALIQENLTVEAILGGVNVKWHNPSEKTVFVYMNYNDGKREREKIFSSDRRDVDMKFKGMDTIDYKISFMVEDFSGNKTGTKAKGSYRPLPEQKIDKSTWTLVSALTCNGDIYEGKMVNVFDDVIDRNDNATDNSYCIIHRDNNGGQLRFLSETEEKPLMIVIDLNKKAVLSRLVMWQRAYQYTSGDDGGVSTDYAYYKEDNLRSFHLYVTNNQADITPHNVWNNPLMICDIGDPRDENGDVPSSKIQEAIDGHEFELESLSEAYRYIVIGITGTFGSETQICCSEISLYGLDNQK